MVVEAVVGGDDDSGDARDNCGGAVAAGSDTGGGQAATAGAGGGGASGGTGRSASTGPGTVEQRPMSLQQKVERFKLITGLSSLDVGIGAAYFDGGRLDLDSALNLYFEMTTLYEKGRTDENGEAMQPVEAAPPVEEGVLLEMVDDLVRDGVAKMNARSYDEALVLLKRADSVVSVYAPRTRPHASTLALTCALQVLTGDIKAAVVSARRACEIYNELRARASSSSDAGPSPHRHRLGLLYMYSQRENARCLCLARVITEACSKRHAFSVRAIEATLQNTLSLLAHSETVLDSVPAESSALPLAMRNSHQHEAYSHSSSFSLKAMEAAMQSALLLTNSHLASMLGGVDTDKNDDAPNRDGESQRHSRPAAQQSLSESRQRNSANVARSDTEGQAATGASASAGDDASITGKIMPLKMVCDLLCEGMAKMDAGSLNEAMVLAKSADTAASVHAPRTNLHAKTLLLRSTLQLLTGDIEAGGVGAIKAEEIYKELRDRASSSSDNASSPHLHLPGPLYTYSRREHIRAGRLIVAIAAVRRRKHARGCATQEACSGAKGKRLALEGGSDSNRVSLRSLESAVHSALSVLDGQATTTLGSVVAADTSDCDDEGHRHSRSSVQQPTREGVEHNSALAVPRAGSCPTSARLSPAAQSLVRTTDFELHRADENGCGAFVPGSDCDGQVGTESGSAGGSASTGPASVEQRPMSLRQKIEKFKLITGLSTLDVETGAAFFDGGRFDLEEALNLYFQTMPSREEVPRDGSSRNSEAAQPEEEIVGPTTVEQSPTSIPQQVGPLKLVAGLEETVCREGPRAGSCPTSARLSPPAQSLVRTTDFELHRADENGCGAFVPGSDCDGQVGTESGSAGGSASTGPASVEQRPMSLRQKIEKFKLITGLSTLDVETGAAFFDDGGRFDLEEALNLYFQTMPSREEVPRDGSSRNSEAAQPEEEIVGPTTVEQSPTSIPQQVGPLKLVAGLEETVCREGANVPLEMVGGLVRESVAKMQTGSPDKALSLLKCADRAISTHAPRSRIHATVLVLKSKAQALKGDLESAQSELLHAKAIHEELRKPTPSSSNTDPARHPALAGSCYTYSSEQHAEVLLAMAKLLEAAGEINAAMDAGTEASALASSKGFTRKFADFMSSLSSKSLEATCKKVLCDLDGRGETALDSVVAENDATTSDRGNHLRKMTMQTLAESRQSNAVVATALRAAGIVKSSKSPVTSSFIRSFKLAHTSNELAQNAAHAQAACKLRQEAAATVNEDLPPWFRAKVYFDAANASVQLGQVGKALHWFQKVNKIGLQGMGNKYSADGDRTVVGTLIGLSRAWAVTGDLDQAVEFGSQALTAAHDFFPCSELHATALATLASPLALLGHLDVAVDFAEEAARLCAREGVSHPLEVQAMVLRVVGSIRGRIGQLALALPLAQQAMAIDELQAPDSLAFADSICVVANILKCMGRSDPALSLYRRALRIVQRVAPGLVPHATCLVEVAAELQDCGLQREAVRCYQSAADILTSVAPASAVRTSALLRLAEAFSLTDRLGDALHAYTCAIGCAQQGMLRGSAAEAMTALATFLTGVGSEYASLKQAELVQALQASHCNCQHDPEHLLNTASALFHEVFGRGSFAFAHAQLQLAYLHHSRGNRAAALRVYAVIRNLDDESRAEAISADCELHDLVRHSVMLRKLSECMPDAQSAVKMFLSEVSAWQKLDQQVPALFYAREAISLTSANTEDYRACISKLIELYGVNGGFRWASMIRHLTRLHGNHCGDEQDQRLVAMNCEAKVHVVLRRLEFLRGCVLELDIALHHVLMSGGVNAVSRRLDIAVLVSDLLSDFHSLLDVIYGMHLRRFGTQRPNTAYLKGLKQVFPTYESLEDLRALEMPRSCFPTQLNFPFQAGRDALRVLDDAAAGTASAALIVRKGNTFLLRAHEHCVFEASDTDKLLLVRTAMARKSECDRQFVAMRPKASHWVKWLRLAHEHGFVNPEQVGVELQGTVAAKRMLDSVIALLEATNPGEASKAKQYGCDLEHAVAQSRVPLSKAELAVQDAFEATQSHLFSALPNESRGWSDRVRQVGNSQKHIRVSASIAKQDIRRQELGLFVAAQTTIQISAPIPSLRWWHFQQPQVLPDASKVHLRLLVRKLCDAAWLKPSHGGFAVVLSKVNALNEDEWVFEPKTVQVIAKELQATSLLRKACHFVHSLVEWRRVAAVLVQNAVTPYASDDAASSAGVVTLRSVLCGLNHTETWIRALTALADHRSNVPVRLSESDGCIAGCCNPPWVAEVCSLDPDYARALQTQVTALENRIWQSSNYNMVAHSIAATMLDLCALCNFGSVSAEKPQVWFLYVAQRMIRRSYHTVEQLWRNCAVLLRAAVPGSSCPIPFGRHVYCATHEETFREMLAHGRSNNGENLPQHVKNVIEQLCPFQAFPYAADSCLPKKLKCLALHCKHEGDLDISVEAASQAPTTKKIYVSIAGTTGNALCKASLIDLMREVIRLQRNLLLAMDECRTADTASTRKGQERKPHERSEGSEPQP